MKATNCKHVLPQCITLWTALFITIQIHFSSALPPSTSTASTRKGAEYYSIVPAEFYDNIDKYEFIYMYNLIFRAVGLGDESCNIIYQNCILNSDNNNHVSHSANAGSSETAIHVPVSTQCFPLRKAKYCLHKANFVDSDCVFNRRVQDKARLYHAHLYKNLEACIDRFPVSRAKNGGPDDTSYSKQMNNGAVDRPASTNLALVTVSAAICSFLLVFV
jgi:hypothetical protein